MTILDNCLCCGIRVGVIAYGSFEMAIILLNLFGSIEGLVYKNSIFEVPEIEMSKNYYIPDPQSTLRAAMVHNVISLIANILLMWGAFKGKRLMLIPWMSIRGLNIILSCVVIAIFTGLYFSIDVSKGFTVLFIGLTVLGISVYIWMCVYSLYQKIKLEEQPQPNLNVEELSFITPISDSKPPPYSEIQKN